MDVPTSLARLVFGLLVGFVAFTLGGELTIGLGCLVACIVMVLLAIGMYGNKG